MFTTSAYATANADDHQYIETIGDSVSAVISGLGNCRAEVVRALEMLRRSLQLHFVIEENIMSDLDYQGLVEHRRSHLLIIGEVSDCLQTMVRGDGEQNVNVWPHVKAMLRSHAQRFDQDLIHHLDRVGIPERPGPVPAVVPLSSGALM